MAIRKRKYWLFSLMFATLCAPTLATESSELPTADWSSLYVVDSDIIWIGSHDGQIAVSSDTGQTWNVSTPGGRSSNLNIRQIIAYDERHAFALSSGRGERSRLVRSRNGGFSWSTLHRGNGDEFLHCFDMIPEGEGWILGETNLDDWHVIRSSNSSNWIGTRSGFSERALMNESGSEFGNCVVHDNNFWVMGTKGADQARLIYKSAAGLRFQVVETPLTAGSGNGIHSVAVLGMEDFLLAGGAENGAPEFYRYQRGEFTELSAPPVNGPLTLMITVGDWVLAGNETGVHKSNDLGADWLPALDNGAIALSCSSVDSCWLITPDHELKSFTL
ncbi:hypothetical protein CWE08_05790 [Aliidiomarina iranensis]|uniref:Photosynthesis system II assembly factor Ycf48/Hcf136-like domain-containing protein n=1 Tax=Aliidiomarina iranensis TaxID=1434071 RepID=A0A432VX18_9GAMM|nr:hypothetical protein [Aliidiomarina iranensis]RUO21105.1 hypothetical protein CWE08_05790 [Aliidiomarina iranensis]